MHTLMLCAKFTIPNTPVSNISGKPDLVHMQTYSYCLIYEGSLTEGILCLMPQFYPKLVADLCMTEGLCDKIRTWSLPSMMRQSLSVHWRPFGWCELVDWQRARSFTGSPVQILTITSEERSHTATVCCTVDQRKFILCEPPPPPPPKIKAVY